MSGKRPKTADTMPCTTASLPPEGEAAIEWMMRLSSSDASEEDRKGLDAWLDMSPANAAIWSSLNRAVGPLGIAAQYQGPQGALGDRLRDKAINRRTVMRGLLGLAVVGGAGATVADRFVPLSDLTADHLTLTGQQATVTLDDGSDLVLGPRTAVDVNVTAGLRSISLRQGQIMLKGRAVATSPIVIQSSGVTLESNGGTFVARRSDDIMEMVAVDSHARVSCLGYSMLSLDPGTRARFDGASLTKATAKLKTETAWVDGLLVANSETLSFVIARMRPYFSGVIRVDPSIADRLVTGVFLLRDLSTSLDALGAALDLSVSRVTPYWIRIAPKVDAAA